MRREIKFRGLDCENKWQYGYLFCGKTENNEKYSVLLKQVRYETNNNLSDDLPFAFYNDEVSVVDKSTVGEYTGLKDKNGIEIYEDDIVKAPLLDPIFGDIIKDKFTNAVIKYNNGSFVVSYYNGEHNIYIQDLNDRIEVVGDIHNNPMLLNE